MCGYGPEPLGRPEHYASRQTGPLRNGVARELLISRQSQLGLVAYSDEVGRAYRPEVGHRLRCEAGRLYRSEAGHLRGPCLGRGGRFIEWCLRSSLECGSASFAKAFSAKIDAVSVVNDTVQDRVGQRGISDDLVPAVHGDLAGDEDGSAVVAIFDDLE
jgi:hypothetical protein